MIASNQVTAATSNGNIDNTVLECITARGIGRRHQWYVFIDSHRSNTLSTLATTSSYRAPNIYNIEIENSDRLRTEGGTNITIEGTDLGTTAEWNTVAINPTTGTVGTPSSIPKETNTYQYFGEATMKFLSSSSDSSSTFEILPTARHASLSSRCSLPSALTRFVQGQNTKTIVVQAEANGAIPAATHIVYLNGATTKESKTACYTSQRWKNRGCFEYNILASNDMSSESSTDTRYIDKLATDLTRADIRAKCATAAEHNGRKYFGIYNGNICKFGTPLENEFFYTKNLKSFDSSSCFRDSSGNVDIFELHADNPSGSTTATKAQRSAMTSTYITEVTATGAANTNLKLDGTRVWSVYVRATGIVDMSNIGVKSGPIESRGTRRFPNGFSIESGTEKSLSCHTITNHTKLKCYVPAGLGTDFNVWSTLGGQSR